MGRVGRVGGEREFSLSHDDVDAIVIVVVVLLLLVLLGGSMFVGDLGSGGTLVLATWLASTCLGDTCLGSHGSQMDLVVTLSDQVRLVELTDFVDRVVQGVEGLTFDLLGLPISNILSMAQDSGPSQESVVSAHRHDELLELRDRHVLE